MTRWNHQDRMDGKAMRDADKDKGQNKHEDPTDKDDHFQNSDMDNK